MPAFTAVKIDAANASVAATLRRARCERSLDLDETAARLGINRAYLRALEEGSYGQLPTGVYGRNFLREYAAHLKLDVPSVLAAYEEETRALKEKERFNPFARQIVANLRALSLVKAMKNAALFLVLGLIVVYLGFYIKNITTPPTLELFSLPADTVTSETVFTIAGRTDPEARIAINGEAVTSDGGGYFTKEIILKKGVNEVTIAARNKYSREKIITREILLSDG